MLRAGLKFLIKDALRGARHSVRRASRGAVPIDFPGRSELTGLADTVLTSIEETVVSLRYGSDLADDMIRAALGGYVPLAETIGAADFAERFASRTYRLSKGLLARRGLDGAFISELAYARAGAAIGKRAKASADGDAATARWPAPRFAAEVAVALIEAEPIQSASVGPEVKPGAFVTDTNAACAYALGLAVAAFLMKAGGVGAVDCVDSGTGIAEAGFARFHATRGAADPVAALAAVYAELAPFVP